MKYLTAVVLLLCALGASRSISAQNSIRWFQLSSDAEYFRVMMPREPKEVSLTGLKTNYGDLEISGKLYEAFAEGAIYKVWVLTNDGDPARQRADPHAYLDSGAELIWEGLLKPDRDKLPDDLKRNTAMTYVKGLPAKPLPGREYTVTIGDETGTTQFYVAESRIYVLLALNSIGAVWTREKFFGSFVVSANLPGQLPPNALSDSVRVEASNDEIDSQSVFRGSEVSTRARVLHKPEPTYTEGARKFGITGTVVLRAIFSRNGEVTNIHILRRLPHGLTQNAVKAARSIRFTPAQKDGQPVSMWMQLEYNFNLF